MQTYFSLGESCHWSREQTACYGEPRVSDTCNLYSTTTFTDSQTTESVYLREQPYALILALRKRQPLCLGYLDCRFYVEDAYKEDILSAMWLSCT